MEEEERERVVGRALEGHSHQRHPTPPAPIPVRRQHASLPVRRDIDPPPTATRHGAEPRDQPQPFDRGSKCTQVALSRGARGLYGLISKENYVKTFLAMKFTTQHVLY